MKKYKALYTVARSALKKIAGEGLFQEKTETEDLTEKLLMEIRELLLNPTSELATEPEQVEGEEKREYKPLRISDFSYEYFEKLKAHTTKDNLTDWQATTKQMQAFASTVLDLLDGTESIK